MWIKISDDVAPLPRPQQDAVIEAANAERLRRQRQALAAEKGRHRADAASVSRRVVGYLSAAILAGCGITYVATVFGLLP